MPALLASVSLLTILTFAAPAWADGGMGGAGLAGVPGGSGGGSAATGNGQDGGVSSGSGGGGGGGGAGLAGGVGGAGTGSSGTSGGDGGTGAGGDGGAGGDNAGPGGGGGGGGGAHGAVATVTTINSLAIAGGAGGRGGSAGASYGGGGGGAGGFGLVVDGVAITYTNNGTISGGLGGNGGGGSLTGTYGGGDGGDGGHGLIFTGGGTLTNNGSIAGGGGGSGGVAGGSTGGVDGAAGAGGIGVVGANLAIVNNGTIAGGLGGDGTRAHAITFTGGVNSLTLLSGSTISGDAVAFSAADTLALGGSVDATFDASLIGAQYKGFGTLQKIGSSTWTVTGTPGEATAWRVDDGTLVASGGDAIDDTATVTVASGATLSVDGSEILGSLSGAGSVVIQSGYTLDVGENNQSATFSGSFSGDGSLEVVGDGTFTVTGNSAIGGELAVCCSSLDIRGRFTASDVLVSGGSLQVSHGGHLTVSGDFGTAGNVTVASGGILEADSIGASIFGNFTVTGAGSVARSAVATFLLEFTDTGLTVADGGRLETSGDAQLTLLTPATVTGPGSAWTVGGTLYLGDDSDGPASLTVTDGASLAAGAIDISEDSILRIGTGAGAGSLSAATIVNDGAIVFDHADDTAFGGAISGAGSLTKQGSGMLTLGGASTYSGGTAVSAGTLRVNGSLAGSVSVAGGATLGGSGSIGGAVTLADAATLSPGNSPGVLSVGALSLSSGSRLAFELGRVSDRVDVAGDLTIAGRLDVIEAPGFGDGTYRLFTYGGAFSQGPLTLGAVPIGYNAANFTLATGAGAVDLTVAAAATDQIWNGGSGIWNTSETVWTDPNGTLAETWAGQTGIFRDAGGAVVTVEGPQSFHALRFDADGYRLRKGTNGALAIAGSQGDIRVAAGAAATIALPITGAGRLAKGGGGTLILAGANTYSGGTLLAGGVLQVSADANLGDAAGGLTLQGGTLRYGAGFASARALTLAGSGIVDTNGFDAALSGPISGKGSLTKAGSGRLTLTGTNRYSGGTTIAAGILAGSAGSFGAGAIVDDAALVLDQGSDGVLANVIAGTGALTKQGKGTLTLTGNSPLSGPTFVQAGTLSVDGSLPSSVVTLARGTMLSGTGTVGGLVARGGATVAPGPSIGTLTVAGSVTFQTGSIYQVEIDDAGRSDRIVATGTAILAGGTVQVLPDQGVRFLADHPYPILTAQGGITGRFADTRGGAFAFVAPRLAYAADAVTLTLARTADFHSVAVTRNQYATADGVEALGPGNRLFDAVLVASTSGARQAFDVLSGDVHASVVSAVYGQAQLIQDSLLSHLRQPFSAGAPQVQAAFAADGPRPAAPVRLPVAALDPQRGALWGSGFGAWGRLRGNGNAAALTTETGGFLIGAEARLGEAVRLGAAGGFARTAFDARARLASGAVETTFGALYGSAAWGGLSLRLGAAFAGHDVATSRSILFPGFAEAARAASNGTSLQAFGEAGYRLALGRLALEPFLGAALLRLSDEAFQEQGGAAALSGLSRSQALATATLGLRAEAGLGAGLQLSGLVGWRHAAGNVTPQALLAFAGGASAFSVAGVPVDRDALVAEAGLSWQASPALSLGLTYAGQVGARAQQHSLAGNLTWRF